MKASRSLVQFAAYVAFFPQIVAGPIQRPEDFFAQLPPHPGRVIEAAPRIAWGLCKKLLIADSLAPAVNYVFAHTGELHGAPLWMGMYLFPLQLYADFSGLTDIAIGAGRLFGITGPENFNRPFTASSISEYWRRWHMSLTTWLADFVFMPLRMALRDWGNLGLAAAIAINMVAIGLWHGLAATFLVFGLLHASFLVADVFTARARSRFFKRHREWDRPATVLGCILTFHLVALAMVFFRAAHVADAVRLVSGLFAGFPSLQLLRTVVAATGGRTLALGLGGYAILELAERYRPDRWVAGIYAAGPRWGRWAVYSTAAVVLIVGISLLIVNSGASRSPFIYEIF
jgi:D-alanyl-lipoteichoic acid acyltransferase DltB (MBOAT superfamily)